MIAKKIIEKIKEIFRRGGIRLIMCLSAAAVFALMIVESTFRSNASYMYNWTIETYDAVNGDGEEDLNTGLARSNHCRDMMYSDLCMLGTVYLKNCHSGSYQGTPELYENMYAELTRFSDEYSMPESVNIIGDKDLSDNTLDIEQSNYNIMDIDSDYYYFYVSYGNEYLTNIEGADGYDTEEVVEDYLLNKFPDQYYLRQKDEISTKTLNDESGLGKTEVYYTIADKRGNPALTSEYISSDKLLKGAACIDSLDRYIFCFSKEGDKKLASYRDENYGGEYTEDMVTFDNDGDLLIETPDDNGNMDYVTIDKGLTEYKKILSTTGGAYKVRSGMYGGDYTYYNAEDIPGYEVRAVDTSKLTVFMTPKFNIAETAEAFVSRCYNNYQILEVLQTILFIAWIACCAVSVALMIKRSANAYINDGATLTSKLKDDGAFILMLVSFFTIAYELDNVFALYSSIIYQDVFVTLRVIAVMIAAHIAAYYSIEYMIRRIKIYGIRSKPQMLILDLWNKTAGIRSRVLEKLKNSKAAKSICNAKYIKKHNIAYGIVSGIIILYIISSVLRDYYYDMLMMVFVLAVVIVYIYGTHKTAKDIGKLESQVDNMLIDESIIGTESELKRSSPLYSISQKLTDISIKAEEAVEERVKSEKMKIELVTNVSHDLKTPLTSIVSYIDLLEKTELSEEAADYVKILARKSEKLREIVQDVFSLAKAVSGVEIEQNELDLCVLARQVIGDSHDSIENSGRDLRINIEPSAAPIIGDGAKLYRVIQNLLENALKYSMPGTRIYFDLKEDGEEFELTIKNVSEVEMDFTAEEILERFSRGDKSRTDGGSGLGLSIAKSFTEACGGSFEVVVDGDVFKALVRLARREIPEVPEDEAVEEIAESVEIEEAAPVEEVAEPAEIEEIAAVEEVSEVTEVTEDTEESAPTAPTPVSLEKDTDTTDESSPEPFVLVDSDAAEDSGEEDGSADKDDEEVTE